VKRGRGRGEKGKRREKGKGWPPNGRPGSAYVCNSWLTKLEVASCQPVADAASYFWLNILNIFR